MSEAIVEFDYKAERPDELSLVKGDIIRNIVQQEGGWWSGMLNGRKGVFPDNFVRMLEKKKRRKCIVLFSYAPANGDELELQVDQEIEVLEEVEEGWWKGRLDNKTGVFPSNFVKVIPDEPAKKTERIQEVKQDTLKDKKHAVKTPALKPPLTGVELCRATFAYNAVNNDELNLQVGDIVTVLSKDTQEPGWWKGEFNGKVGVFPDNFVELISADKNSLRKKSSDVKKKEPESDPVLSLGNKTPPLLPKKPKAALPVPDVVDAAKKAPESKAVPEPQIMIPDTKLIAPETTDSKSTPPAASEARDKNEDFDSVPRADLLGAPMRPKAPRRRPPSAVLKQNGHSDSFEDKTDTGENEVRVAPARLSAELRAAVPFKEATPPRPEDLPKEALREPTKLEMKKSPFMEELKGAVNQVKKDKPPAKPRPLSIGLTAKAPPTSPRKSPTTEKAKPPERPEKPAIERPEKPIFERPEKPAFEKPEKPAFERPEKPAFERPVSEKTAIEKPAAVPPPALPEKPMVVEELKLSPPQDTKKVGFKPLSLEERVKELEDMVRRMASALREETRNRLRLEEEVERLVNRVVQI